MHAQGAEADHRIVADHRTVAGFLAAAGSRTGVDSLGEVDPNEELDIRSVAPARVPREAWVVGDHEVGRPCRAPPRVDKGR